MIGPIFHPGRYPPSAVPRPPIWARRLKIPFGLVLEGICGPLAGTRRGPLLTPEVRLPVRDLAPELSGYRIGLVTDLHHGPVVPSAWIERVAARAGELRPDLIVLGGDFVSHHRRELDGLDRVLATFRARDGVVGVFGNHDHWVGTDLVGETLRRAGIRLLCNDHLVIARGGARLAIAGVDDFTHGAVLPERALAGVSRDVPRVLVSHNPDLIEYLPQGLRVDVMLSGHTHNGQIHFPFFGPLTVPSQFGRRYLHGEKRVGGTALYVSAGVGSSAIAARWGNPPELPLIVLERAGA
ncbi:MAG TPA: metallophosphoesterase [Gemmatimonadales bacterium]|nr:metallophosphoesterase [Gemmatimonadales bacterium]